ncbi:uncharacterized protein PAC_13659 [Phialocephala subalpina]|uniref:Uncharacterized protein n=1 Tax=Phialocephala subalpina TaxID=576137 RepID=A0A1L7XFF3_9HELO|nr:uncharacterized protein PAC_13659 [Phialocephala subalpina]
MLRRERSNRFSHRKSTSSIQSTHESINPEVARQQAQTAAMLAFTRAQQRSSADSGHNGGALSRSNTINHPSSSNNNNIQSQPQQTGTQDTGRVVRRQQSVRFVGVNGLERRESLATRASQAPIQPHTIQTQLSSATLKPIAMTTSAPVPAIYRPPSRSSSIGKASIGKGSISKAAETLVAANVFKEYYTQEDGVASTPSSYRRIHRSRSMFSPGKAPSIYYTNGSPEGSPSRRQSFSSPPQNANKYTDTPPATEPPKAALRAPKSMSFLRSRRTRSAGQRQARDRFLHAIESSYEKNDITVQQARDRFFHETEQQRLRRQPSFLFKSRAKRQEKPFRKSVRSSSSGGYGMPASSPSSSEGKSSSLKAAARKASEKVKYKFRRVFGRSKEEPMEIPNQQVEAPKTHVRKYNGDSTSMQQSFENFSETFTNIPHPDSSSLSRVASRIPSIHTATSNQQLQSHAGSVKSFKSDQSDDKSRVSSLNTIQHVPKTPVIHGHHRLSVINEVGTHKPSSSVYRKKYQYMNQCSAYPRLQIPEESNIPPPPPPAALIDHPMFADPLAEPLSEGRARLAEVLLQQINATRPETILEKKRRESEESQEEARKSFEVYIEATEKARKEGASAVQKVGKENMFALKAAERASREILKITKSSHQRSSSVTSSRENRTPATIRCVPPSMSSQGAQSVSSFNQWSAADSTHSSGGDGVVRTRDLSEILRKSVSSLTQSSAADSTQSSGGDNVVRTRVLSEMSRKSVDQVEGSDDVFSPKARNNSKENAPINQTVQHTPQFSPKRLHATEQMAQNVANMSPKRKMPRNAPHFSPKRTHITDQVAQNAANLSPKRNPLEGDTQAYLDLPTDPCGASPQKIANRNEKIIRDKRSTFFGGSAYTIPRKGSPFRLAMAENGRNASNNSTDMPMPDCAPPMRNPLYLGPSPAPCVSMADIAAQLRKISSAYSESIYSRTTGGGTNPNYHPADSAISLALFNADVPELPARPLTPGDAVIVETAVYQPTRPGDVDHHVPSSAGSQEWKQWMSSEVARFERVKENNKTPTYVNYALPTMPKSFHTRGHVREAAQIHDDEEPDVGIQQPIVVKQPLSLIAPKNTNIQAEPLKSILKKPSVVSFADIENIPIAPPLPPPIPPKSPLRNLIRKASLRSVASAPTPNKLVKRAPSVVERVLSDRRKRIASESDETGGVFL